MKALLLHIRRKHFSQWLCCFFSGARGGAPLSAFDAAEAAAGEDKLCNCGRAVQRGLRNKQRCRTAGASAEDRGGRRGMVRQTRKRQQFHPCNFITIVLPSLYSLFFQMNFRRSS